MDLNDAADTLYALPPAEFTAARDALAKEVKAAGNATLARDIGKLRRPTVVAWAVNQLARQNPPELAELLTLGEDLRRAWQDQDAKTLTALSARRTPLTARVARLIADLAASSGQRLTTLTEVEQTLDAAVVDAEAATQVRQATLTTALAYSGFAPAPAPVTDRPRAARPTGRTKAADLEAQRERRVRELAEAAAAAEREVAESEAIHADWARELAQAVQERDRRAAKVTALETKLAELEAKLTDARAKHAMATKRADAAQRDESRARRTAEAARARADTAASKMARDT
ncbi:hypothetical protein GCM10009555_078150 [Acrocarpospora macrocephala]|uniref:Uncharacterized protein n=1 Tax=Acrocarpospora macrocephala TaxID=150177 RepID=A0A5M3X3R0_9ACTN|nr:hypothetical protein [Acrocarpospora macrocephala]GES15690.1 hypothetical protein Amac_092880 [Acrocarpospora macrocephala]